MYYGVVWRYTPKGEAPQKLMAHPETFSDQDSADKAKQEGRATLAELEPLYKTQMMPLAVVEINEEMIDTLNQCDLVEMEELMFINIDDVDFWVQQSWWSQ